MPATKCILLSYVAGIFWIWFCFAYIVDKLVYTTSRKEHLQHLEMVFKHLKEANLKSNLENVNSLKNIFTT